MGSTGDRLKSSETTDEMTLSRAEYKKLLATIKQQTVEIETLEYRIKTLLPQ